MFRIPDFQHSTRVAFSVATIYLLSAPSLVAHPGHGSSVNSTGVAHYLTSPMHMVPGLVLVAVAVAAVRWLSAKRRHDSK